MEHPADPDGGAASAPAPQGPTGRGDSGSPPSEAIASGALPGSPGAPASAADVGAPDAVPATRRTWLGLGPRKPRRVLPHPYADERSTSAEHRHDPRMVTMFWLGLATAMVLVGVALATRYSSKVHEASGLPTWDGWTEVALFGGLGLLGFGFVERPWARRMTLAGWLLFAFYWSLVALDLFVTERSDYVNLFFAFVGTYFFTYLAYHQWLSEVRNVRNPTVRFLNVSTFVAAGAYFVIDKVEPVRRWLIVLVSDHTAWMLQLFGQGSQAGLVYHIDPAGSTSDTAQQNLATFWYTDVVRHCPSPPHGFWENLMHFDPTSSVASCVPGLFPSHPHEVLPVSIILACTALQSIMLFVGLFMGTDASWRKRIVASAIVATVVYVLNLLRNTGIVWFYGQGKASFWIMHDAIGKGGSLIAMVIIAFAAFAWFPEFLRALIGVLDLYHRDGPVERTLRLGRRRPAQPDP